MEAFLAWLGQNVAWETLKKALPANKRRDLKILRDALEDAQQRNRELEEDRQLLERIVRQRNIAFEELRKAKAEISALKREIASAKTGLN